MSKNTSGRFVWHDLMTTDVKSALAFYGELFGWKTTEMDMGPGGKYLMIKAGDRDIGGIVELDAKHGIPSHWIGYCAVADVDGAARRAAELGGKIAVPATDIPEVGRFAVIEDPQGGHVSPFKGTTATPEHDGPPPAGAFCWDELLTSDPGAALAFYREIFGWGVEDKDMGPMGTYHVLKRGEAMAAGIMAQPMPGAPTAWLAYVAVDDVDASAKRAERLRGKIVSPPTDIPGIGRFSVIQDPTGAFVSLFKAVPG
jgi:predicted enzyme related to lactoylglutathione lyase